MSLRKKIGFVTLLMALACIVGVAGSYGHGDSQLFANHWLAVFFDHGDLCWLTFTDDRFGRGPTFRLVSPALYLVRVVPGWRIVLMLMLFSAYLLFSKPRQSNQATHCKRESVSHVRIFQTMASKMSCCHAADGVRGCWNAGKGAFED